MNIPFYIKITLPLHLLLILSCFFVNFEWHLLFYTFVMWALIAGLGISVGFHRCFSHKSIQISNVSQLVILFFGTLAAQGNSIFWVAGHRGYHHPHADSEHDIHSPTKGFFWAYMGWVLDQPENTVKLSTAREYLRNQYHLFFAKHYVKIFWGTYAVVTLLSWLFYNDLSLLMFGLIIPSVLAHHQENIVNAFCHSRWAGYRNFDTKDNSINNKLLSLLTWGGALHNNHHQYPKNQSFAVTPFEIDPGMIFVWILNQFFKKTYF